MALTSKWLIALLSIAAAMAGEKPAFTPGPLESYPLRATIEKVTIAASPFRTDAQTATAFGKLNPNRYGVLPILVLIRNGTDKTISLDKLKVEFHTADRDHIEATPAADVRYIHGANHPSVYSNPIPGLPGKTIKGKNPLNAWEIEGRAFTARMLPPGETASGFFYFRAFFSSGSLLYLTGIREPASGKDWFYFEIPLE